MAIPAVRWWPWQKEREPFHYRPPPDWLVEQSNLARQLAHNKRERRYREQLRRRGRDAASIKPKKCERDELR